MPFSFRRFVYSKQGSGKERKKRDGRNLYLAYEGGMSAWQFEFEDE